MFIVSGATGHVGSAVAANLLDRGADVLVITRDQQAAQEWADKGAATAIVDINDITALTSTFRRGTHLFALNPPADPTTDTDVEERRTADAFAAAVADSSLEKVLAASTYGAQPGTGIGDLGTLYHFEQALAAQQIPMTVMRSAYYMSNWDASIETARSHGVVSSFFPADFTLPMVAPRDIGRCAADLLVDPGSTFGTVDVEGPERYVPQQVADVLAELLGRDVRLDVVDRADFESEFRGLGFSPEAARSYAGMTELAIDAVATPEKPVRGPTTLEQYLAHAIAGA